MRRASFRTYVVTRWPTRENEKLKTLPVVARRIRSRAAAVLGITTLIGTRLLNQQRNNIYTR